MDFEFEHGRAPKKKEIQEFVADMQVLFKEHGIDIDLDFEMIADQHKPKSSRSKAKNRRKRSKSEGDQSSEFYERFNSQSFSSSFVGSDYGKFDRKFKDTHSNDFKGFDDDDLRNFFQGYDRKFSKKKGKRKYKNNKSGWPDCKTMF